MKAIQLVAALFLLTVLSADVASAQQINAFDAYSSVDTARNTILLELSTGLVTNSLSLNYEYQFLPRISARLGVGASMQMEGAGGAGVTAGLQFFTEGDARLEAGVGMTAFYGNTGSVMDRESLTLAPALNIGYRYQPVDGGMMFRIGLSHSYNFGFPIQASTGYAF